MQVINHIFVKDNQAYIAGRSNLKAEMVARMVVDGAYSIEEVMEHYQLSAAEVHAAIAYYHDNHQELDRMQEQKWASIHENALDAEDHLASLKARRSAKSE